MAIIKKSFFITLIFWASQTNLAFAQIKLMSPILAEATALVAKYEKANNIILKYESDYLYATTDSFSKTFSFPFLKDETFHLDLFGQAGNLDIYTISIYNIDTNGRRISLAINPKRQQNHVALDFKKGTDQYVEIEIKARPNKADGYYVRYGLIITREKGDVIEKDESILSLVQNGETYAKQLESKNIEPVHIEINTVERIADEPKPNTPPPSVVVTRRFSIGRTYYGYALSGDDVPELRLYFREKQKGIWGKPIEGEQQYKKKPTDLYYVRAEVAPDSMAEYATVVQGIRFKEGEIAGRCLIIIAAETLPAKPDIEYNSPFRSLRGKTLVFNHHYNPNEGGIERNSGTINFSEDMTKIMLKEGLGESITYTIISRSYDEKTSNFFFETSDIGDKRHSFFYNADLKIVMKNSFGDDIKQKNYILYDPILKQIAGKTIEFKKVLNTKGQTIRNEKGNLKFNNILTKAVFSNTTNGISTDMSVISFYYGVETKSVYFTLKNPEGKIYNWAVSNTTGIYDFDSKEIFSNE